MFARRRTGGPAKEPGRPPKMSYGGIAFVTNTYLWGGGYQYLILSVPDSVQGHLVPLLDISSSFSQKVVIIGSYDYSVIFNGNDPEKLQKESINPRFDSDLRTQNTYVSCLLACIIQNTREHNNLFSCSSARRQASTLHL